MRFRTFGDPTNPILLLIHGLLLPWQIWEPKIDALQDDYFIIVPALNGHVEEEPSEFVSSEQETAAIEEYILKHYGDTLCGVYGISMGAIIANELFCRQNIRIKTLFLDGPPLIPVQKVVERAADVFYMQLIEQAKARNALVLKKLDDWFLPEEYLPHFLKFVDMMSDTTISNLVDTNCRCQLDFCDNIYDTQIVFLYGSKFTETLSKASVHEIIRHYPKARILHFPGYHHAQLCLYEDKECVKIIKTFVSEDC